MQVTPDHGQGAARDDARVLATLEPPQLVASRRVPYGRRPLAGWPLAAMWGLRLYTLLMILVVCYSIAQALQTGG